MEKELSVCCGASVWRSGDLSGKKAFCDKCKMPCKVIGKENKKPIKRKPHKNNLDGTKLVDKCRRILRIGR